MENLLRNSPAPTSARCLQALDLSAEATALKEFKDWFWKARLGKCYYKLGEKPTHPEQDVQIRLPYRTIWEPSPQWS